MSENVDPRLPPVVAAVSGAASGDRRVAHDVVSEWLGSASNLAVVLGHTGSGKSYLLERLNQMVESDARYTVVKTGFDARGGLLPNDDSHGASASPTIYIVDNFDALNSITGIQTSPPDLSAIAPLLHAGNRVVLASRRSQADPSDELSRQLAHPLRAEALGARFPYIVELLPWDVSEIVSAAGGSDEIQIVSQYLRANAKMLGTDFLRPLTLKMLILMSDRLQGSPPKTLARVYDEYVSWALSRDYDRRQSVFNESHKRQILVNLAYDIFCGQPGTSAISYSVTRPRLIERVMEVVSQDALLRSGARSAGYEWVHDFLSTNHLVVPVRSRSGAVHTSAEYAFDHPSFFEYFVARAILDRLAADSSLGIRENALSEATFRSMVLYFVREYWDESDEVAAGSIAKRKLTWPDRLLFLYMLEMSSGFGDLLRSSDPAYFDDVVAALPHVKSMFIRKAIKYQLVLTGRYSAWDYIADLRTSENENETSTERWLLAADGATISESLVARMNRADLRLALPIAVYRLGQMGDERAIDELRRVCMDPSLPQAFIALAEESISRISSRASTTEGA